MPLHSKDNDPDDDMIEIKRNIDTNGIYAKKKKAQNPFKETKSQDRDDETISLQPCLIPFRMWQENEQGIVSNQDMPVALKKVEQEIHTIETQIKDEILNSNSKKDCEGVGNNGVFFNNSCHYYNVLHRICMKIQFYDDLADDS